MTALLDQFLAALDPERVDPAAVEAELAAIIESYDERHRHYHTLKHVIRMLLLSKGLGIGDPDIALATFYHDVIYRPGSLKNEEKSAAFARESLARLRLDQDRIEHVAAMILATASHLTPCDDPLIETFLDLDMSILGASREEYAAYAEGVRREYPWLPGFVFNRSRRRFLEGVLGEDRIFHTDLFRERFEDRARGNITWELAERS